MATAQSSEEYLASKKKDIDNLELQIDTIRIDMRANLQARREAIANGQFEEYDILDEKYKELDAKFMRYIASLKEIHRNAAALEEAESEQSASVETVAIEGGDVQTVDVESEPREHVPVPQNPPQWEQPSSQLDVEAEHDNDPCQVEMANSKKDDSTLATVVKMSESSNDDETVHDAEILGSPVLSIFDASNDDNILQIPDEALEASASPCKDKVHLLTLLERDEKKLDANEEDLMVLREKIRRCMPKVHSPVKATVQCADTECKEQPKKRSAVALEASEYCAKKRKS